MTRKPIVFVSCGQVTAGEQRLGRDVCELVRELTDYEPYFAETVTSLGGLTQNIFKRLHEAAAYVFILHARGQVSFGNGESTRASVWVEQEVAITAFLTQILSKQCHVAAYAQQGVALEGVRKYVQMNPIRFEDDATILQHLRGLLPSWRSAGVARHAETIPIAVADPWYSDHAAKAAERLARNYMKDFMEVRCLRAGAELPIRSGDELQLHARQSQYPQTNWPIGVMDSSGKQPPKAFRGGFVSEIVRDDQSVDYSAFHSQGKIYILRNLWETHAFRPQTLVGEARITQVAEAVLFCLCLLQKLGATADDLTTFSVRHGGYRGFRYLRTYQTNDTDSNEVASDDSLGAVQLPRRDFLLGDAGPLRVEPFITMTSDLFVGCDMQGIPEHHFFETSIRRFLESPGTR